MATNRTPRPTQNRIDLARWLKDALTPRGIALTRLVYSVELRCEGCGAEWFFDATPESPAPARLWRCRPCSDRKGDRR